MNLVRTLRIPIAVTALILCGLAAFGWHDHQRLLELRAAHEKLVARVAARGLQLDPGATSHLVRPTKRPRVDRAAEARQVAAGFIDYAREMAALGEKVNTPDAATRRSIVEQMDEVTSLDNRQLAILIDEIFAAQDLDEGLRQSLIRFSLERLGRDHPERVMAILAGTPGMIDLIRRNRTGGELLLSAPAENWAARDPQAAMEWFRANREMLGEDLTQAASSGVSRELKKSHPALAIRFAIELGANPMGFIPDFFADNGHAPKNRDACLAALREWSTTVNDEYEREKMLTWGIRTVALGVTGGTAEFESATRWMDRAELSPKELGFLADRGLERFIKPEESGRWIEWLADKMPTEAARDQTWRLFEEWTRKDYRAAGTWLTHAAESPAKHTAARAYAEKIFPHHPEAAIRWALTVPEGPARDSTLKRLYDALPKNSAAEKAAAGDFAREH